MPLRGLDDYDYRRRRAEVSPLPAPVFIVGHWRSGTTHLHNLLGQSPAFGHISPIGSGLPDELLTLGTWLRPWLERALPKDRAVDRVAVTPTSPQEDEIPLANQQSLSVFHALYFPQNCQRLFAQGVFFTDVHPARIRRRLKAMQHLYTKIAIQQGRPRLLIKNPVYTAHIARLQAIWPTARFIHVIRNPYTVFASTVHYYRRLLPNLALQDYRHLDIEALVLEHHPPLLAHCARDCKNLPDNQWVEVRYEDLIKAPIETLGTIHERLELPGWPEARLRIEAYLEALTDYRPNRHRPLDPHTQSRIERHWGAYIQRWGYSPPDKSSG